MEKLEELMSPDATSLELDFNCGVTSKGPGKKIKATATAVVDRYALPPSEPLGSLMTILDEALTS